MNAPPNTVVILAGTPYALKWDKGAMYRADELGLFDRRKPGLGIAAAAKYLWAMAPAACRERFPTPLEVAEALPPMEELPAVWEAINNAVAAGREGDEKKAGGSTSGRLPASSSA